MTNNNNAVVVTFDGAVLGVMTVAAKEFKTGSVGFYGMGKMSDRDGARYQVQVQLVRIGSKATAQSVPVAPVANAIDAFKSAVSSRPALMAALKLAAFDTAGKEPVYLDSLINRYDALPSKVRTAKQVRSALGL